MINNLETENQRIEKMHNKVISDNFEYQNTNEMLKKKMKNHEERI